MCSATLMYSSGTSTMRNHIKHKHLSVMLGMESQGTPEMATGRSTMMEYITGHGKQYIQSQIKKC